MKANKFFLGLALVGAILTACEKEPETPVATGEVSYISVNLNYANQGTRADFENGEENENAIKDVTFFFFDANENAYAVNTNDFEEAGNGVSANSITVTKEQLGEMQPQTNGNPVEEISNAVLVIERNKVTPPSYMLAVVNCPNALKTAGHSLATLKEQTGAYNTIDNGQYFVMANSVYVNGAGEAMYATPITNDNLAPSKEEALATGKPVEIYVERTAAKVRVNNFAQNGEKRFNTGITTNDGAEIWAEVTGWHVTDVNSTAYLLKKINPTWDPTTLGLTWNDAPRYRSYWATSTPDAQNTNRHPYSGSVIAGHNVAYDYYYENTTATADNRSQLIVTAKFYAGETETQSIDIAEWWGVQYTLEGLKTAIANSLASQLYVATETAGKYESITPDYIAFEQDENDATDESATAKDEDRYWSNAVLATGEGLATKFYNAQGRELSEAEVTAIFEGVRHAKIWSKEFGGYYYLDIEHLGTGATQYGLVRNHLYDYTLTNVSGLGTPIFDGEQIIIPEEPEGEETFISPKLNVQAWRVVTHNDVTLQ